MTQRPDCIQEILNAIKDRRDRKYVEDHLDELDGRVSEDDSNASQREKYFRAAKEMLDELLLKSAILRRNVRMDALKLRDNYTYIDAAHAAEKGSYRLGIEARLVGVNRPFFDPKSRQGNQASAGAISLGAQRDWIGGAVDDMARAGQNDSKLHGLDKLFFSREIEDLVFIEKIELEKEMKGRLAHVGRTENPQALAIARILQKWDKVKVASLNAEGAWITEHSTFGATMSHDPDRMLNAAGSLLMATFPLNPARISRDAAWERSRIAWVAKTLPRIDAVRMFGRDGAKDADKNLYEMFDGLVNGDHGQLATASVDPIFPNLARKVSAEREFVWKSTEDQLAHMKEFGRYGPTDAWVHGLRNAANRYAMLKVFGSKPKEGFEELLAYAQNRAEGPERAQLNRKEGSLRAYYDALSSEGARPIHNAWTGIVNGITAAQRWSKLGLTPYAMLQDNITLSRELAYQGINVFDRYSSLFSGYFRGEPDSAKREVAELLHAGILGRLRGVTARFDTADARSGVMSKLDNLFFKITGITAMTENKRADAERLMAWHFGRQKEKAFAALDRPETRIMEAFGIGDREWDLLRQAEWNTIEGETYLTPDVAMKIPDAAVEAYLSQGRSISQRAEQALPQIEGVAPAPNRVEKAKQDLGLKLWSYFGERGQYAVLEVGPKERAILYGWGSGKEGGLQSGSTLNNALRLLLQFKQFPTAMITRAWGREIYGGEKGMGRVAGLVELTVGSTLFGMLANWLNQYTKGQDPNAQMREQPVQFLLSGFLRGGAASVYGDFLLGEWSRFGFSAAAMLAGPSLGQIDRVAEVWSDITHPSKWKASSVSLGVRMARENTPFANMIYTKAAIDYLVFYNLMEWLNPGYLSRYEQSMKDRSGIEFWLRPQQTNAALRAAIAH